MKEIMMKIIGTQMNADMEEDKMEFITEGKLYQKGDSMYLLYDESEISGMPGCKSIQRLNLKRESGIPVIMIPLLALLKWKFLQTILKTI